uniref:SDR family NAD(P)-dependent oxidoreductase n=1 Tax=uncultured Planktosalinus sp. TaxID=1810935 RepID=UPI0030D85AF1
MITKKVAIVTGGSRGIGSAICQTLAKESDYYLLINYTSNQSAAETTLQKVEENGGTGEIIKFDVSNSDEVKGALTAWQEANPDLVVEVVVNNAGITKDGLFMWMTNQDWDS